MSARIRYGVWIEQLNDWLPLAPRLCRGLVDGTDRRIADLLAQHLQVHTRWTVEVREMGVDQSRDAGDPAYRTDDMRPLFDAEDHSAKRVREEVGF